MASKVQDDRRVWPRGAVVWLLVGLVMLGIALFLGFGGVGSLQNPSPAVTQDLIDQQKQAGLIEVGVALAIGLCGLVCLAFTRASGLGARISPSAIRGGVVSNDDDTRLKMAKQLRLLRDPDAPDLALGLISDRVAAIRVEGIKALDSSPQGRQKFIDLLSAEDDAAGIRVSFVGWLTQEAHRSQASQVNLTLRTLLPTAVKQASSPQICRELLLIADQDEKLMPWLQRSKANKVLLWPSRCCNCGSPNPGGALQMEDSDYVDRTTTTVTLSIPICESCRIKTRWGPKLDLYVDMVKVKVASGEFAADLLGNGSGWEPRVGMFGLS